MKTQVNYKGQLLNYDIYDDGTVISRKTGKRISTYDHPSGYISISLMLTANKQTIALLHRVVMMSFCYIEDFAEYKSAGGYLWSYKLKKMSKADKVKFYKRAVLQKDKNSLKIIARYESASEAAKKTKIQQSDITRTCQGKRKTAGGFCWSYE